MAARSNLSRDERNLCVANSKFCTHRKGDEWCARQRCISNHQILTPSRLLNKSRRRTTDYRAEIATTDFPEEDTDTFGDIETSLKATMPRGIKSTQGRFSKSSIQGCA